MSELSTGLDVAEIVSELYKLLEVCKNCTEFDLNKIRNMAKQIIKIKHYNEIKRDRQYEEMILKEKRERKGSK